MKNRIIPLLSLYMMIVFMMCAWAKQKVLIVVNSYYYYQCGYMVDGYKNDVEMLDNKKVEIIEWPAIPGSNVELCTFLLDSLQSEYVEARNAGDVLEGAVMIGDVPVPQYSGGYGNMPLDQVFMDIVDTNNACNPYTNGPYFTPFAVAGSYYANNYNTMIGDSCYDIWVSRINAAYMSGLREGMSVYDEYSIYGRYLSKVDDRMNMPATVPSRGFFMGGPEDLQSYGTAYKLLGIYMNDLNLPWLADFSDGHNSSFNWMSQLLAGPRGCINYGACNGTLYATNERNRRFCRYEHLPVVYEYGDTNKTTNLSINLADSLGWEWAGLYNHGCPMHSNFFSNEGSLHNIKLNGEFKFGTIGTLWGSSYVIDTAGYGESYHYYQDSTTDPNPYNYGFGWKNKGAEWRWIVPAGGGGDYDVYLYYEAPDSTPLNTDNCTNVNVKLHVVNINSSGLPISHTYITRSATVNQQAHFRHLPPPEDYRWEKPFDTTVTLGVDQMAIVSLQLNDGLTGNHIVDAVRFIRTSGGVDQIVDDAQPGSFPDIVDDPSGIFDTTGFHSYDDVYRGFEDMGSEPGGGGCSKTQFFLMKSCNTGDFTYTSAPPAIKKNIGNLYALGYNGLICMAPSEGDNVLDKKGPFTRGLRNGMCFGQAYLDKIDSTFGRRHVLLGAGTLRAQPYIQYGSDVHSRRVISDEQWISTVNPVIVSDVTVLGTGSWYIISTHTGASPFGTHSEIVVRAETVLSPEGENEVRLTAN